MAKSSIAHQWSTAWTLALERLGLLKRGAHGSTGRQRSRIKRIEVLPGRVHAEVQEQTRDICHVTLKFAPLTERAWGQLVESLSTHVLNTSTRGGTYLIQNGVQRSIDEVFHDPGAFFTELSELLLPGRQDEIEIECTCCPLMTTPCSACEMVYRQVGAMLNEEPILLLRLRGREWQALQQALQARSTADYLGSLPATNVPSNGTGKAGSVELPTTVATTPTSQEERSSEPLEQAVDHFWGSRKTLDSLHYHITSPSIDLALLRRLGPLPSSLDDDDLYQEIAKIYRLVTGEAQALAYSSEPTEVSELHEPDVK
ncbi:MAG: hypothetical protein R3E79_52225 [Caldilineaceae bacterium]